MEFPLPICPRCGAAVAAGDSFCGSCGLDMRAVPAPQAVAARDEGKRRGLDNLRNSFLFLAMGAALSLVPGISIIGSLLSFIGLILLIIGWRALGRSALPGAPRYMSTGNWIIYSIILAIVVGVAGVSAIVLSLLSSLASSGFLAPGPGTPGYPFQTPAFQGFFADFYALIIVAEIPVFYAWYRVSSSLRALGAELGQRKLDTAGRLFLVYVAVQFAALVATFLAFTTGAISFSPAAAQGGLGAMGNQYTEYTGAGAAAIILIMVAGTLLMILTSYTGYTGVKRALNP